MLQIESNIGEKELLDRLTQIIVDKQLNTKASLARRERSYSTAFAQPTPAQHQRRNSHDGLLMRSDSKLDHTDGNGDFVRSDHAASDASVVEVASKPSLLVRATSTLARLLHIVPTHEGLLTLWRMASKAALLLLLTEPVTVGRPLALVCSGATMAMAFG